MVAIDNERSACEDVLIASSSSERTSSAKLALEVYARKMQRDRETAQRMEALVWAQTGTNDEPTFGGVASPDTPKELEPAR